MQKTLGHFLQPTIIQEDRRCLFQRGRRDRRGEIITCLLAFPALCRQNLFMTLFSEELFNSK